MSFELAQISPEWTLFLDRDGVINVRPMNDYVKKWSDFQFLPGVLEALSILGKKFNHICIITNQQGIGKNEMTEEDLSNIHHKMQDVIREAGGRVDAVYHCSDLATKPVNCRKPGLAMAKRAAADFPEIDFSQTVMVGDTMSDMRFGINGGFKTVYVGTDSDITEPQLINIRFDSLIEFARKLSAND